MRFYWEPNEGMRECSGSWTGYAYLTCSTKREAGRVLPMKFRPYNCMLDSLILFCPGLPNSPWTLSRTDLLWNESIKYLREFLCTGHCLQSQLSKVCYKITSFSHKKGQTYLRCVYCISAFVFGALFQLDSAVHSWQMIATVSRWLALFLLSYT